MNGHSRLPGGLRGNGASDSPGQCEGAPGFHSDLGLTPPVRKTRRSSRVGRRHVHPHAAEGLKGRGALRSGGRPPSAAYTLEVTRTISTPTDSCVQTGNDPRGPRREDGGHGHGHTRFSLRWTGPRDGFLRGPSPAGEVWGDLHTSSFPLESLPPSELSWTLTLRDPLHVVTPRP